MPGAPKILHKVMIDSIKHYQHQHSLLVVTYLPALPSINFPKKLNVISLAIGQVYLLPVGERPPSVEAVFCGPSLARSCSVTRCGENSPLWQNFNSLL